MSINFKKNGNPYAIGTPVGGIVHYAGPVGSFTPGSSVLSYVVYAEHNADNLSFVGTQTSSGTTSSLWGLNAATNGWINDSGYVVSTGSDKSTVVFTGYFLSNYTGVWTFNMSSDDGCYLWLGNGFNGSNYTDANSYIMKSAAGSPQKVKVSLISGVYYPIRILYGNSGGPGSLTLSWSNPSLATVNGEGNGYFYNGTIAKNTIEGFLICDGSAYSRTTYASLFSAIGTNYGAGDGSTTFNVPNLQNFFILGSTGYTSSAINNTGGNASYILKSSDFPGHSHSGAMDAGGASHTHNFTRGKHSTDQARGGSRNQLIGPGSPINGTNGKGTWNGSTSTDNPRHSHGLGTSNVEGGGNPVIFEPLHTHLVLLIRHT